MTVLAPKYTSDTERIIKIIALATFVAAAAWVYLYTQTVTASYSLRQLEDNLQRERVANAELKEKLYGYLNPSDLDKFVSERNLIRDNYPQFVSVVR